MILAEYVGKNSYKLSKEIKVVVSDTGIEWIRFEPEGISPAPSPSGIITDRASRFPDHPKRNEPDFYSPCDSKTCQDGKFLLRNGELAVCFRCKGFSYISVSKHQANLTFDQTTLGQEKIRKGENTPFD